MIHLYKSKPSALILAAGNSGRMGRLKAFLPFNQQLCFLEKVIHTFLDFGIQKLVVVLNKEGIKSFEKLHLAQNQEIQAVLNAYPEKERFYSVQTGLKALQPDGAVFIHNVDNPFVQSDVLEKLIGSFRQNTYVVPTFKNKGGHPILLSPEIARDLISTNDYSQNLKTFLHQYTQTRIAVNNENILININTPKDYEKSFGISFQQLPG